VSDLSSSILVAAGWELAQQCRAIVQSCLRDEEWQDADQEFFRIICNGLSGSAIPSDDSLADEGPTPPGNNA
jgi:hypothetical protein